jgi:hypothetical protein
VKIPTESIAENMLVGARGFEPPTPCAQGRCATRLRYAPTGNALLILNQFDELRLRRTDRFWCNCAKTVPKTQNPSVDPRSVITDVAFVGLPIQFEQCFALHLQFHLRILLEYFRVSLPQ